MPARRGLDPAAVVAAAADLADREGIEALTLTRVADQLGVRTPSLYAHVAGLDDLRRQVALRTLHDLAATLSAATVGIAGDAALHALGHAYRDFARTHPGRYAAIQRAPTPGDDAHEAAGNAVLSVIHAVLRGYNLTDDAATHATRILRSTLHGFTTLEQSIAFALPVPLEDTFEHLLTLLSSGLRQWPTTAPSGGRTPLA